MSSLFWDLLIFDSQPCDYIYCHCGLKFSLSPFLFILVADVLSKILEKATNSGFIQKVSNFSTHINASCLQYANNTLLLEPTNSRCFTNLGKLLYLFEQLSSLTINYSRFFIYKQDRTTQNDAMMAYIILHFGIGKFPFTYLGISLKPTSLNRVVTR